MQLHLTKMKIINKYMLITTEPFKEPLLVIHLNKIASAYLFYFCSVKSTSIFLPSHKTCICIVHANLDLN
uniref:Uncharacterized protein n=1 Tax=Rhizophora mucronata TaxID=61149 RepID=A0A2P2K3R4_RHIMU